MWGKDSLVIRFLRIDPIVIGTNPASAKFLLSGDQGYHSSSSEACQDHQKLNSFTPFPSFTA